MARELERVGVLIPWMGFRPSRTNREARPKKNTFAPLFFDIPPKDWHFQLIDR